MLRSLLLLIASTTVTVLLVLGFARLPGGEALRALLASTGESWTTESFEDSLGSELNQLRHQHLRPMFLHLTMLQIAKQAHAARQEIVGTYPTISQRQSEPVYASQASQHFESMRLRYDLAPARSGSQALSEDSRLGFWSALAGLAFIVAWVRLRQI